jgi:hypothetical protein
VQTILTEYLASMENITNSFYFSFLSLNFINQRPFLSDVVIDGGLTKNTIPMSSINNFGNQEIQEFGNSIRRHALNDIVIAYERYSMLMFASHNNNKNRTDPAMIDDRNLGAHKFEKLDSIYDDSSLNFLVQLRRLRNCIVHYNGVYSETNMLNYTFGEDTYNSVGNEGASISIKLDTIVCINEKIIKIVEGGNRNYHQIHQS